MTKLPRFCSECGKQLLEKLEPMDSDYETVFLYCPVWDNITVQVPRAHTYLRIEDRKRKPKFDPDTGEPNG